MITLSAWCLGVALLIWVKQEQVVWTAWLGVVPGVWEGTQMWGVAVTGLLTLWLFLGTRPSSSEVSSHMSRQALARFWQQVAVLLSAGLTFWQAVEVSAHAEPYLTDTIAAMADQIVRQPIGNLENTVIPGEDGDLTLQLLQHGYVHGVTDGQIESHVRHIESRLAYEDEARRRRDPLWMTVLPALLLLNVLWIFITPMISMAHQSWFHL